MGTSGNMPAWGPVNLSSSNAITGQLARTNLPNVGAVKSADLGTYNTTSAAFTNVSDGVNTLTITMTTTGRPVMLMIQGVSTGTSGFVSLGSATSRWQFLRDGATVVSRFAFSPASVGSLPSAIFNAIDTTVTAGSHTWVVQGVRDSGAGVVTMANSVLVGYEL